MLKMLLLGCAAISAAPALSQVLPRTTELEAVQDAPEIDKTTLTEDVTFRDDDYDRMTVQVRIGGAGPFRFLVDTAADRTVVSTQLASRLNLTLGPTATLHSATGASTVRLATVPGMEVANGAARTVQAPMLDAKNMGADGILGIDSLRSRRVLFDFQNRLISIVPSAVLQQREEKGTIIVRGKLRKGHLILTKAHADDVRLTVLVDTGAEISLGNLALKRALERRGKLRDRRPIHLLSVTGERLQGEFFFLQELEIGGVVLRDLAIVFADAHTFGKLGLGTKPTMMLGMNGMRAFQKVSIDFASKKLRVLVPRTSELSRPLLAVR